MVVAPGAFSGTSVARAPVATASNNPPIHSMAATSNRLGNRRAEANAGKVGPGMAMFLAQERGTQPAHSRAAQACHAPPVLRLRDAQPVDPNPPLPRSLCPVNASTRLRAGRNTGTNIICANRSPGSSMMGSVPGALRFQALTRIGPR